VATALAAAALAAFAAIGALGGWRYVNDFWTYRGFAPPKDPAFVTQRGTTDRIYVASGALGGRRQPVDVYLPPGYATHPHVRYPVLYLLHGFPGRPGAFLQTIDLGVVDDVIAAKHLARPPILVMPFGSTGTFTDEEWANGVRPGNQWETFVARDLVHAIDARYRTIANGGGRALAGLSEGGYGALNIGLHHPGEFRVLESWSGYQRADRVPAIFGHDPGRLAANSPLATLPAAAQALRRAHTYVWFYTDTGDQKSVKAQNVAFAHALALAHIPHRFAMYHGGHTWALWRVRAMQAVLVALTHLSHA
jgi:enterochelin esterase-like enzyme